ncbi:BTB/POZ protein [Rhizophagus irregularis DAOM 181602=DAOM 197198]|nr:BTB/POZ protein [Rhizophagus irregularis DAOM 181602=DAOM 197198]
MDDNTFLPKLSQNLLEILEDNEYYDTTIEVVFQIILRYIYGGRLSLKEYDTLDIIKILVAANELKLISKEPEKIFNSIDFNSISEKCLITLIKQDDIQLDDIQIWEHVLKWVKDSDEILGGYNPTIWDSFFGYYSATEDIEDCFIFSFKSNDSTDIANNILSRVTVKKYAIYNDSNFGPSFNGLILFGSNYYDESYCRNSSCYEKPIRETEEEFSVEEYEVFQIMKTGKTDAKKELKMRKELKGLK